MSESKTRSIEFTGSPSRDGDFHLLVDRATFEKVTGREPEPDEKASRGVYRLYPQDWAAGFRGGRKVKVKLSVQPM